MPPPKHKIKKLALINAMLRGLISIGCVLAFSLVTVSSLYVEMDHKLDNQGN